MSALLDQLRAVSATLRDIDHAPDHIEVDPVAVSALLAEAATALAESERAREALRRERNAAMNGRDEERAEVLRMRVGAGLLADHAAALTAERNEAREALASCDATRQRNAEHYRDACNGLTTTERELAKVVAENEKLRGWREECDGMMVAISRLADDVARLTRERDAARAEVARLMRLASGPHINDEVTT